MADIVTEIADRLKSIIPGFTDDIARDFEAWVRAEFGRERHYISRSGETDAGMSARNRAIIRDMRAGESPAFLARKYRVSVRRIYQIYNGQ